MATTTASSSAAVATAEVGAKVSIPAGGTDLVATDGISAVVGTYGAYETFDANGKRLATWRPAEKSWEPHCGIAVAGNSFFTVKRVEQPAAGLIKAKDAYYVTAWSLETGQKLWETKATEQEPASLVGTTCSNHPLEATQDGQSIVFSTVGILDAATGRLQPSGEEIWPIGKFVGTWSDDCSDCHHTERTLTIRDPKSFQTLQVLHTKHLESGEPAPSVIRMLQYGRHADSDHTNAWLSDGSKLFQAGSGEVWKADVLADRIESHAPLARNSSTFYGKVIADERSDSLFVQEQAIGEVGPLRQLSLTGLTERWRVDGTRFLCAVGPTAVSVIANDQLVTLDRKSGKQVTFVAGFSNCGTTFGNVTAYQGAIYRLTK